MLRIDIISVFPSMVEEVLSQSIIKKALKNKIAEIYTHNLRDYTTYKNHQIDDYPYGGEAGMVLMAEPLANAIETLKKERPYDETIYMCPDGERLNQQKVNELSLLKNILIICGRYKGIDERIRALYITKEISIGDYVISGGELAACVLADALIRVIPGAIGDETSALTDSFQDNLLSHPVYTRPAVFKGLAVPEALLGGNHKKIQEWRTREAERKTKERRPDLL